MPITLQSLINKRKEIEVKYGDDTVMVAYRPYSQAIDDKLKAATAKAAKADGDAAMPLMIRQLIAIIVDWDITDGADKAAISEAVMRPLPTALLLAISKGIAEDQYPNLVSGAPIAAG